MFAPSACSAMFWSPTAGTCVSLVRLRVGRVTAVGCKFALRLLVTVAAVAKNLSLYFLYIPPLPFFELTPPLRDGWEGGDVG